MLLDEATANGVVVEDVVVVVVGRTAARAKARPGILNREPSIVKVCN